MRDARGLSRSLVILAAAVLVVALVAGFFLLQPSQPPAPKVFRMAVSVDIDTFDPASQTTTTVANMLDHVVETLFRINEKGELLPNLATEYRYEEEGKVVIIKLRSGVKFHDGSPLTAQAVKFSLERVLDPKVRVPIRAPYTPIERVEVVDDLTVRLVLKYPFAPLIHALTWTTSAIISPKTVETPGNNYTLITRPIGTGPYVISEYVRGDRLVLTRAQEYWGKRPYYDQIVFKIVPDAATRLSLILAGEVDMIMLPPVAEIERLKANPNVKVLLAPSDRLIFISINNRVEPFNDKRVRQALNYAVDKESIIKNVMFGIVDPVDAPMHKSLFGYCPVGQYPYDPAKARELLRQAGVRPGTKVLFLYPTGRYINDAVAAQAVAGYLREVGFDVEMRTMDWPTYVATINRPPDQVSHHLHLLGWAPAYLDAYQMFLVYWSGYWPPAGLATSYYKNPRVDELFDQQLRITDPNERAKVLCEIARIVWDDAPFIFLWTQNFPLVYSAKIKGVSYLPNEKFVIVTAEPA
ncbi:MAG: ABC transporter substrate-binding protein [Candidatus Caldarchaeales archaeon]